MPRSVAPFAPGNRANLRLTPKIAELFVATIRITGRISVASGRCAIGSSTAYGWLRRGREEKAEPAYKEFADEVERARAEYLTLALRRLNQLAVGGLVTLPAYDKTGSPIRAHGPDCAPDCRSCELITIEKVCTPDSRILMWQVDRLDPSPNGEAVPDVPESRELSDEARHEQGLLMAALFAGGMRVLDPSRTSDRGFLRARSHIAP